MFSQVLLANVVSPWWREPVKLGFSVAFAIGPALVAVIIVVGTEALRDRLIGTLTDSEPREKYTGFIIVTTEFARRIIVGASNDTKVRKR
jgi:hypothetical protein